MNQLLESLDKWKDIPIVRFISQFLTQSFLSPAVNKATAVAGAGHAGTLAKELLIWAIVLALIVFIIDQAFYWTSPGQIDRARANWLLVKTGAIRVGTGVRNLAAKVSGGRLGGGGAR